MARGLANRSDLPSVDVTVIVILALGWAVQAWVIHRAANKITGRRARSAAQRRREDLQAECEALRRDPDDVAEMAAVLRDMEHYRFD